MSEPEHDKRTPNGGTQNDGEEDEFKDDPNEIACNWNEKCQPKGCQCFARPSCLLAWLCLSSFTQGLVVNGFVNSVLTTLELRYDLSSSESGLIASMYDIGSLLCLVPVTYIGHRYRRSRLISIGLLIMGIGSFVFSIPQFTAGAYNYQSPVSPLCYLSGISYPDFCKKQNLNSYKFVFWLGQFLHGVGASPLYTLAVAYLDDNLTIQQSGAFLGAYYTMSLIGPAMGYLLGGIFQNIFVEPGVTPTDITPENTNLWVGAWWIGFLFSGAISCVSAIPIFGFPKHFPDSTTAREQRKQETHGNTDASADLQMKLNAKDLLSALLVLFKNPTFVFLSFGGAIQSIIMTGLSTFGPKILQILFFLSRHSSNLTIGMIIIPGASLGLMAGGLSIRFTEFSLRRLLWLCPIVAIVDTVFALGLLSKCDVQRFAGVNQDYSLTPYKSDSLTARCNQNCGCQDIKFMYNPMCGADSNIYFSPCYAGCQTNATLIDGKKYYKDCACLTQELEVPGHGNFSAVDGACTDPSCKKVPILLTSLFLFVFFLFSISVPILQCTMRAIPARLKDFGLGLQWVILRMFGSIPGPLVLGRLIDNTCSLWTGGCGEKGSCGFYDGQRFWSTTLIFIVVLKCLEILFLILAAALYVPPDGTVESASSKAPRLDK